ncbi:MAG: dual specificity protein phosphatase family protein [Acidobacteria bacterium]|nr:dual specificity protein phosphatase family protein [Acidobacteriota bacterium]
MPDYQFVTDQLAVGGAIWTPDNMGEIARAGFTHIVNLQIEFDDRSISDGTGIRILWNGCDDDFMPKPSELFWEGVRFALEAIANPQARVLFHCAAGIHRSPLMLLAVLRVMGHGSEEAMDMIRAARPQADFPLVYLESLEDFLLDYEAYKQLNESELECCDSGFPQNTPATSEI